MLKWRKVTLKNPVVSLTKGFSMGDLAAARGSEIILRGAEIKIFEKLIKKGVMYTVHRFLRFRDDISLHLAGKEEDILLALEIIVTNYPKQIVLNVETEIIAGKFLNIKLFNSPKMQEPFTSVLRKKHAKYCVIPPSSNTVPAFKKCAGSTYFRTAKTHCSTISEYKRQCSIVEKILSMKGYSSDDIVKMSNISTPKKILTGEKKKFCGTTTFDAVTESHRFMKNVFSKLKVHGYYSPMAVPDSKLKQYIFTIRSLKRKLGF